MRIDFNTPFSRRLCAVLVAAGFATAAVPALAQQVGEITVMGRMGPDGQPQSLSRAVSIADLDLRAEAGVDEMRSRIRGAARDLCRQLGETAGSTGLVPSCESAAFQDAMTQGRVAIAQARAPGAPASASASVPSAGTYAPPASAAVPAATYTTTTVTNGPVPDTAENRAKYGQPMSNAGKRSAARGN